MSHETEVAMLAAVDELTEFFDAESVSMRPRLLARLLQRLALECAAHELDKRTCSHKWSILSPETHCLLCGVRLTDHPAAAQDPPA